jgi:hypothetical protein
MERRPSPGMERRHLADKNAAPAFQRLAEFNPHQY